MMFRISVKFAVICVVLITVVGCSSTPNQNSRASVSNSQFSIPSQAYSKQRSATYKKLHAQYQRWKGTPYSLGDMDKNGIDCSGFVHVAFRDAFGMKLPRTTEALANKGKHVPKHHLNVGDLVFFKTGISKRHVGIYVGNQQFIHASTSRGVMKSNLTNPYWSEHYWKSTRLLAN
jgi:cell wall-associated NlpC family hydrolase